MCVCIYNTSMIDYVEAVAHDVRHWAEQRARRGHRYGRKDLCGWCARASAELHGRLARAGIASTLHVHNGGPSHVFVRVGRWVVDVTATQFSQFYDRPVVILSVKDSKKYRFYESDYRFSSTQALVEWQRGRGWPECEVAKTRLSPCRISREVHCE